MPALRARPRLPKILCASVTALLFVCTCDSPAENGDALALSLSADAISLSPGQTAHLTVRLSTRIGLNSPAVLSLRSAGDGPLPKGLNAAFDPSALSPMPGADASAQLHLLAQMPLGSDRYSLFVHARNSDRDTSVPLKLSVIGNTSNWRRQVGTLGTDQVVALAGDHSDGVYVAINTTSALANDKNLGGFDGYLLHYRANGAVNLVKALSTASPDIVTALAVDAFDNAYVAGFTYGAFPGKSSAGKADAFIAKVGSDGELAWLEQLGTSAIDQLTGVAVASDGSVYVAGLTQGAFPGNSNAGGSDAFVARLFPDGKLDWITQFGTTMDERTNGVSNEAGVAVTVDSSGNIYACGSTQGTFPGATAQGLGDAFITRLQKDGKQVWLKQLGSLGDDALVAIAAHESGTIYAAGWARGPLANQVQIGGYDGVVIGINAEGTVTMARQLGTSAADYIAGLFVQSDRIYISGTTRGVFSGQQPYGMQDIFFAQLNLDGSLKWLSQIGTSQADSGSSIAGTASFLYLGGTTFGDFDTDDALVESDGIVSQYHRE